MTDLASLKGEAAPESRAGFEAAAEEYRALRAELVSRIEKQQDITNFAILATVGFFAAVQATQGSASLLDALGEVRTIIPLASAVFSAFTLMALDHEMNIAHLSIYMEERLRPRLAKSLASDLGPSVFEWNSYRARWQQHAGFATALTSTIASAKYAMTVIPNIALLVTYWHGATPREIGVPGLLLYLGACLVLLWVLACSAYTSRAYIRMAYAGAGRS